MIIINNKYPLKRFKHIASLSGTTEKEINYRVITVHSKLFDFLYCNLNTTVNEQITITPSQTTNIVIATYDPRFNNIKDINTYTVNIDDVDYTIINQQNNDKNIHNPTLLTLTKKDGV